MKTKSKKVTARRMWTGDEVPGDIVRDKALVSVNITSRPSWGDTPYFILPCSPESYDQLIEQGARAMYETIYGKRKPSYRKEHGLTIPPSYSKYASAILASAGITRPKK